MPPTTRQATQSSTANALPPITLNFGPSLHGAVSSAMTPASAATDPMRCPFCARVYVPAQTEFACPNCGASTPLELLKADSR